MPASGVVPMPVTVVSISASTQVAPIPKSQFGVGRANSSASTPNVWASGTFTTMREEQLPASTFACRSSMSE
jgi:hypothetical protein